MGETIAIGGLVSVIIGTLSLASPKRWFVGKQSEFLVGAGLAAVIIGGVLLFLTRGDDVPPPRPVNTQAEDRVVETLRAYMSSNAPQEAAAIDEYDPNPGAAGVVVKTTLFSEPASLAAGQRICEIARNVIFPVRVEAADGSELWSCDRVESRGNPQLAQGAGEVAVFSIPSPFPTLGDEIGSSAAVQAQPKREAAAPRRATSNRAPAVAASEQGCHSSYEGECLPVGRGDVDCAGGGGNGPLYAQTRNIRVVGSDVYGLDADGDGLGCDAGEAFVPQPPPGFVPEPPPEIPVPPEDPPHLPDDIGCHPYYDGECLPVDAPDVDCAGGGGNGPYFAQRRGIAVVGPDVFGLDSDGDGYGCE